MKEHNIQMQSALDGNYINIVLPTPCRQDKIAVRVIKKRCPEFLLSFGITDINDQITLKYKVPNAISLKYMNGSFTKQMFLDFYEGLLEPFVKGYDWFLDYHYVCVVSDYIYVDKQTIKSKFLYVPEQSYRNTDEDIIDFLKNVLNKVIVTDDSAFLVQLYQYFNGGNVVISDLDHMIKAEKNKTTPLPAAKQPAVNVAAHPEPPKPAVPVTPAPVVQQPASNMSSNVMTNSQPPQAPNTSESSDNDVMNVLFGAPSKKKEKPPKPQKAKKQHDTPEKAEKPDKAEKGLFGGGLFGKKKAKPTAEANPVVPITPQMNLASQPVAPAPAPVPIFNNSAEDSSVTMISGIPYQTEKCLELIESEKAGAIARISLDFPNDFITIGRSSGDAIQPDIRFDRSFMQISRMHLRIERKGDSYYAIDLGSGNHTLIDGQMMVPNTQYQLRAGAVLSIAANIPVRYRVNI